MPYNFAADGFYTKKNLVADFLWVKCTFRRKTGILCFWAPSPHCFYGASLRLSFSTIHFYCEIV